MLTVRYWHILTYYYRDNAEIQRPRTRSAAARQVSNADEILSRIKMFSVGPHMITWIAIRTAHEVWCLDVCRVLQCVAVCCSVLQCVAVCCSVLQCVAVRCSVLQCVAVCYSVLQCVAVCCSVMSWHTWCRELQCVAVHCSVLQCVAVCCSVMSGRTWCLDAIMTSYGVASISRLREIIGFYCRKTL